MTQPTCDQCDCVAGCQANPVVCPNVAQLVFHLRQYGDVTATQLYAAIAQSEQSKQELGAIYQYQMADGSWIDQIKDSYKHNLRYGNAIVRILYPTPQPAIAQPEQLALSKTTIEKLHKFLDAAAGDGLICDGVDAADLYIEIFPEQYAEGAK